MTEVETEVIDRYKVALENQGFTPELIKAITDELALEMPNAERLLSLLRPKKEAVPHD